MKRRIEGRNVPLEELLEPFFQAEVSRGSVDGWYDEMYAVAAEHGYTHLDVIRAGVYRQMNPRPAPSKRRSKMKGTS